MVNKKIKINYINNLFWLAPSISSYFRGRNYGYSPFKTLEDLVKAKDLNNINTFISFNALGEKNFDFFNMINRIKNLNFRINKEILYKIDHDGYVNDNSIDENLIVVWNKKSINWIKKGYLPFYNSEWYIETFVKKITDQGIDNNIQSDNKKISIIWNKNSFEINN